jgi:hypothetical protein
MADGNPRNANTVLFCAHSAQAGCGMLLQTMTTLISVGYRSAKAMRQQRNATAVYNVQPLLS